MLWAHVDIRGAPAHAARASALGFNAIDAATTVTRALRELEAELNRDPPSPYDLFEHPINLNPGVIRGGDWTSTVAAECTVSYRLAQYPGDDPADLQRRVEHAVAEAAAADPFLSENPPRVRYDGFACEGFSLSHDEPVAVALGDAYARLHGRTGAAPGHHGDDRRPPFRAQRHPRGLLRPAGRGDPRHRRACVDLVDGPDCTGAGRVRAGLVRPDRVTVPSIKGSSRA